MRMESRILSRHLYSDELVRVYAVARFKWTLELLPKEWKGFRGDWTVYIGGAPASWTKEGCIEYVASYGDKQHAGIARALFPLLAKLMDKRGQPYRQ